MLLELMHTQFGIRKRRKQIIENETACVAIEQQHETLGIPNLTHKVRTLKTMRYKLNDAKQAVKKQPHDFKCWIHRKERLSYLRTQKTYQKALQDYQCTLEALKSQTTCHLQQLATELHQLTSILQQATARFDSMNHTKTRFAAKVREFSYLLGIFPYGPIKDFYSGFLLWQQQRVYSIQRSLSQQALIHFQKALYHNYGDMHYPWQRYCQGLWYFYFGGQLKQLPSQREARQQAFDIFRGLTRLRFTPAQYHYGLLCDNLNEKFHFHYLAACKGHTKAVLEATRLFLFTHLYEDIPLYQTHEDKTPCNLLSQYPNPKIIQATLWQNFCTLVQKGLPEARHMLSQFLRHAQLLEEEMEKLASSGARLLDGKPINPQKHGGEFCLLAKQYQKQTQQKFQEQRLPYVVPLQKSEMQGEYIVELAGNASQYDCKETNSFFRAC